jgi:hypothetical protein
MGLIDTSLFSVVIAIGFLTTIITPIIAKPFIYRTMSKRLQDSEIKPQTSESKSNSFDAHNITYQRFHNLIDRTYYDKFLGNKTN